MPKSNRDDFKPATKQALALRANYRCSYPGCNRPTSGPSDESPNAHVSIGVAAHIHAAAPRGPRYAPEMPPEARTSITNGVWLCQSHSRLVDADRARFTAAKLAGMRVEHEARIRAAMDDSTAPLEGVDLIALGPDLVVTGQITGVKDAIWEMRIDHFLIGNLATLIDYSEGFESKTLADRFVLANALGDGRQLGSAPAWRRADVSQILSFEVRPSFQRTDAHALPMSLALDASHDLFLKDGDLATVSGLAALPQTIATCLSTQRGELLFHPTFGTRIGEYFELFSDSPWLSHLLKLEVIRMACIPVDVGIAEQPYTALRCVSRVHSIERLQCEQDIGWIPFRVHLDVQGIGPWNCEISIHVPGSLPNRRPKI